MIGEGDDEHLPTLTPYQASYYCDRIKERKLILKGL